MNTYTFHINTYDLAFFATIFVALTFILLLAITKKTNQTANRFLALAMLTIVLGIARILSIDIGLSTYIANWSWVPLQFSLTLGPLIYFFVLKITQPEIKLRYNNFLHFCPLLLELGAQALEIRESIKTGAATYQTAAFVKLNPILQLLAFISVAIYLYLAHKLITNYHNRLKFNGGDRYRHQLRWLQNLLTAFSVFWFLWIPVTIANYYYQSGVHLYYPLYLFLGVVIIWMSTSAFSRSERRVPAHAPSSLKPLPPTELREKGIWLKNTVRANRYYQDMDISLASLAEKLGLTSHELSRIINTVLKKSFNDLINEYRVKEATRKMQDPACDHITLLGIAYESGFNSQSTFNRIFKQLTGKSPLEYKNDLKKEYPSYNLGNHTPIAQVNLNRETPPGWLHFKLTRNYMFKNYFKIARRNLVRNKSYAAINITGLAVGIAVCLMIFIIIQYQTSFDSFHAKKGRIYRVLTEYHHAESANVTYVKEVPLPMPGGLKTAFPQIEQIAPIFASQDDQLLIPDNNGTTVKSFKEQRGVFFTSPSFFKCLIFHCSRDLIYL